MSANATGTLRIIKGDGSKEDVRFEVGGAPLVFPYPVRWEGITIVGYSGYFIGGANAGQEIEIVCDGLLPRFVRVHPNPFVGSP